ncbi:acyl-CoA desaturase [Tardiphaga robiniae]|uniref:Fatty acid desaturase n=1 Tax=Tardiphaga robiniae TaxID=943830 RepID=A0A165RSA8_9BRAD|nr:acyl-CoA desaturase [Tardiphaga robiniae]KZD23050.1 fatty acid desaturase [Tardiphaga robiniae]
METISTGRMISGSHSDPVQGHIEWVPGKSVWTTTMTVVAVVCGPPNFSWSALLVCAISSAVTICAGHSVGMHRLLIHRAFRCPLWLEHALVYLGVLVGMAGPFGMIYAHDIRDWAQRQALCHDLHAHRRSFFVDAFWQMHCIVALRHPPEFIIEPRVARDRFYRFLEATWMAQQLPWAVLFYVLGDWPWVVWGIAVRISVSLTGHWLIGHFAHRRGHQGWRVDGVAVQGFNLPAFGLVTFGEAYHGNHHAFPESAQLGVERGQIDLGYLFVRILSCMGLANDIKLPDNIVPREGLRRLPDTAASARSTAGCA